jgi:hypothetical protein
VHRRLGDPDDLEPDHLGQRPPDQVAASHRHHLARLRRAFAEHLLGEAVQQLRGAVIRQAGHHELGTVMIREPDGVRVGRPAPLPLYPLHHPAVRGEQLTQVRKVVVPGGTGMIALPAHVMPPIQERQ